MGIYGLLRVLTLVGPAPAWFGWMLFALGLTSGVLGVMWRWRAAISSGCWPTAAWRTSGSSCWGMASEVLAWPMGSLAVALLASPALLHTLNHALCQEPLCSWGRARCSGGDGDAADRPAGRCWGRSSVDALAFGWARGIVGLPPLMAS